MKKNILKKVLKDLTLIISGLLVGNIGGGMLFQKPNYYKFWVIMLFVLSIIYTIFYFVNLYKNR